MKTAVCDTDEIFQWCCVSIYQNQTGPVFGLQLRSPSGLFPHILWEMLPLTSTVAEVRNTEQEYSPPLTSLSFTTRCTDSKRYASATVTDSSSICPGVATGSDGAQGLLAAGIPQPSSIRKHHPLHSLFQRFLLKSSPLSLASTFATSNPFPHRMFFLYRNNLFAFFQLSRLLNAAWGKEPSTFPFQILISLSEAFCQKFPMRMSLLLLLYIFILPFYTQQNAGPPLCHLFSPPASASFHF